MFETDYRQSVGEDAYETDRGRLWLALATGLNLAVAACFLICKSPETYTLSLGTRLRFSVIYLLIACLIGAAGTWMMLPRGSRGQFRSLLRCGVCGWVFLPAIVLFLQQRSVWASLVAVVSAMLMAAAIFRYMEAMSKEPDGLVLQQSSQKSLFTSEVNLAPTSWVPFGLSLCLYGAFLSAATGRMKLFTLLLAVVALFLVLQIRAAYVRGGRRQRGIDPRFHPYLLIVVAFCCVFVALSAPASASRGGLHGLRRAPASPGITKVQASSDRPASGYQTIVLWPIVQKEEKVLHTPPRSSDMPSPGLAKPLVIRFNGPYWYMKFSGDAPGPNSRTTHGDPLKVNVRSTDRGPLFMEAHQRLGEPMALSCCREMQVVFKNDPSLGAIAVGLSLTDSHAKGRRTQNLGIKSIALSGVDPLPGSTAPVEETLAFQIPRRGVIKQFDEITVVLLPDARRATAGRKVAVERFVILPN
ncbi:hypothetical protein [Granulicella sp. dw_53]|uniref:hypothetical protein n=1 Tax=Granulicella sp. dw_53 TaxID=2719792 RepID=UPI001BD290B8|nr:hypothetical protein [Granulicella sp. dw_53]